MEYSFGDGDLWENLFVRFHPVSNLSINFGYINVKSVQCGIVKSIGSRKLTAASESPNLLPKDELSIGQMDEK